TITEDDRAIALNGNWDFGETPDGDIHVSGDMQGIYDNVFKINLVDMSNVQAETTIHNDGTVSDFTLKGLGIFGYNCYQHEDLVNSLQEQDNGPADNIIDFSKLSYNESEGIPIIKEKCKDAYLKLYFDHKEINNNYIKGVINFENPEDVM